MTEGPDGDLILLRMKNINLPFSIDNIAWFYVLHPNSEGEYFFDDLNECIPQWDREREECKEAAHDP